MRLNKHVRVAAFIGCLGLSAGLVAVATGSTGAYFSDAKSGTFTGVIGSIQIEGGGGTGGNNLDFQFDRMLPGVQQTAALTFRNIGQNAQDVWLVFPNVDALHALNNLGSYGEAHIAANGTEVFGSANLNDGYACGTLSAGYPTICPLPRAVKLFSNVAPLGAGSFSFSFNYGVKLANPSSYGHPWNGYPVGAPTAAGLPYQLVGTQVGVAP